jgi:hypothetical protein
MSDLKRLLLNREVDALFDYIDVMIEKRNNQWQTIIRQTDIEREKKIDKLFTLNGEIEGLKALRNALLEIQTPNPDVSSESEDPSSASEDQRT